MVFGSSVFLLYFLPFFLVIYWLFKGVFKNIFIVLASLFFYMWAAPKLVVLLILSIVTIYFIGRLVYSTKGRTRKSLGLLINIGLLVYYKYSNFFIGNINPILTHFGIHQFHLLKIVLPIGISFYTFHEMSFLIDVYRNKKAPVKNILDFSVYVLFFSKLIAGPIVRYHEIADQIENKKKQDDIDNRLIGMFRFIIGLAKKVLIANVLAQQGDIIFALPAADLTTPLAWIGILAYTFQLYFDFAGYSDMAIGIARMMGFVFPENFNNPYISQSITEFWRRWHISLSMWFREYLFLPLAYKLSKRLPKNKYLRIKTEYILYIYAALITFTLCGFWHDAKWTFIFWGAYQGIFIVLDRLFLIKLLKKAGKITRIIFTFLIITLGWVFFRSPNIKEAYLFIKKLFIFDLRSTEIVIDNKVILMFGFAIVFSFFAIFRGVEGWQNRLFLEKPKPLTVFIMTGLCIFLFILSLSSITSNGFNPFIYFRF
jgi:alginate O-acetyltransferase complex protein AlgI